MLCPSEITPTKVSWVFVFDLKIKTNLIRILFALEHPGKCNLDGRILTPGIHQSPDKCVRLSCGENGDIEFATCGVKNLQGCEPGSLVDETKDYPDCCLQNFDCHGINMKF